MLVFLFCFLFLFRFLLPGLVNPRVSCFQASFILPRETIQFLRQYINHECSAGVNALPTLLATLRICTHLLGFFFLPFRLFVISLNTLREIIAGAPLIQRLWFYVRRKLAVSKALHTLSKELSSAGVNRRVAAVLLMRQVYIDSGSG